MFFLVDKEPMNTTPPTLKSPNPFSAFQIKMIVKILTRFQTKTAQNPYQLGWHIPIQAYIGQHIPSPRIYNGHQSYIILVFLWLSCYRIQKQKLII